MILWQLETGKKQFLPHLSATIESIVVSPSGSSYCIRLSDNSAMIISTSSLQPTFNVSDIKLPSVRKNSNQIPFKSSIDIPSQSLLPRQNLCFPAAVSPSVPGHLYLAVPSSTNLKSAKNFSNPACFLQTFDLSSSQQISHQAMTRTKTTIFNVGPEMNTVQDPNISYLQISHDCQWLATIDEWMPPIRDIAFLAFNREREAEEQASRREINLMIWSRNDDTKTWDLNSKIIDPHASSASMNHDVNIVFDLASDPSCPGFATVGNDYAVKVWKPSARVRHGIQVRDNNGKGLINWSCRHITQLEVSSYSSVRVPQGAKLAYSQDGSVLAVGYRLSAPATIYLIDPTTGTVQRTLSGLYAAPLYGLAILDQYLITLSEELRTWNLITEEQQYAFDLKPQGLSVENALNATHLAVNARQANFAITFPGLGRTAKNETKQKSQIIIFDPRNPSPLFFTSTFNIATTLLPALNQKGYYIIDSVAEVRILSPNTPLPPTTTLAIQTSSEHEETPLRGLERIYGNANNSSTALKASNDGEDDQTITSPVAPEFAPASETDSGNVVIPSHKITELFRSNPMPPLTELFERVAELCNGREST